MDDAMLIIELQLRKIRSSQENNRAQFSYDERWSPPSLSAASRSRAARNVDHILTRTLLPEISREFLARMKGRRSRKIHVFE
jgi:type VI secretion system protein VasG